MAKDIFESFKLPNKSKHFQAWQYNYVLAPAIFSVFAFLYLINVKQQQQATTAAATGRPNLIREFLLHTQKPSHQDSVYHFDDYTTSDFSVSALCSIFVATAHHTIVCKKFRLYSSSSSKQNEIVFYFFLFSTV